jgi:hypothetical protein
VARRGERKPNRFAVEDRGYTTPCWIWQLSTTAAGYGHESVPGTRRQEYAHRLAYERANGPIPAGLWIDHLCRNRACVNPDHLEAVPPGENSRRGLKTKLTAAQVHEIRDRSLAGASALDLAEEFGVTRTHIYFIRKGKTWENGARAKTA